MEDEQNPYYYFRSREDLILLIPRESKRILEVGCAAGQTGRAMREKGFEEIVGIEINETVLAETCFWNSW